jgi:GT2 family glycosyltransferase
VTEDSPAVFAIIVSYRNAGAVIACVRSLRASTYPNLQVIVVDNASGGDTVASIREALPGCRVAKNARNQGFGRGANIGIEMAMAEGADFLLLLNQDTVVDSRLVQRLVDWMIHEPRAGAVAPKTLSSTPTGGGASRRLYAGAWRSFLPLIQNIPGIEEADTRFPDRPVRTDYAWGHGVLLRTSALEEVGGFDPGFFMYCEDLDLCRRLAAAEYEIWCEPRAVMWHDVVDGARGEGSESWRWVCKVRSNGVFHRKHFGRGLSGILNFLTVLVEAKRLVQSRRVTAARHLLSAYGASLLGRPEGDLERLVPGSDRERKN